MRSPELGHHSLANPVVTGLGFSTCRRMHYEQQSHQREKKRVHDPPGNSYPREPTVPLLALNHQECQTAQASREAP